jgi:hypothetical protein
LSELSRNYHSASADAPYKLFDHISAEGVKVEGSAKMSFAFKSPEGTIKFESKDGGWLQVPRLETENGAIDGDDGEQDEALCSEPDTSPIFVVSSDEEYVTSTMLMPITASTLQREKHKKTIT